MKTLTHLLVFGILVSVLALAGCNTESGDTSSSVVASVSGSGTYNHVTDTGDIEYTHTLGSTPQDVYFVFTNTNSSDSGASTISTSAYNVDGTLDVEDYESSTALRSDWGLEESVQTPEILLPGRPDVTEYNNNPPLVSRTDEGDEYQMSVTGPSYATVGVSETFKIDSATDTLNATPRKIVTDGTVTINIYVADDSWSPCSKSYCVTQTMVDAFADKFLQAGADNDIYDWVSGIFGAPWGNHNSSSLISSSASSSVDILFFDIPNYGTSKVLGYYWAKDNNLATSDTRSNERLLFYMNSLLMAEKEGGSWEITDYWPALILSTLAHEFQHMIHFYQKIVTYNITSADWINEMSSMVAEDLLADKMLADGPRGVAYTDDSAGSAGNTDGRLPEFNNSNYISPSEWNSSLANYAVNYSFGAYLARNFGGAGLFRKIVQSGENNHEAISKAVVAMGYSETFSTLLQKWGVAVLLSNLTNLSNGYRYNTGSGFASTLDSISYNLGSINMYNYSTQPHFYTKSNLSGHNKLSNTYVKVGTALTGTLTAIVNMPTGVLLTVVTKDSN